MFYLASLQNVYYIIAIVFMGLILLFIFIALVAVLVIRSKVRHKIESVTLLPRRARALLEAFGKSSKRRSK